LATPSGVSSPSEAQLTTAPVLLPLSAASARITDVKLANRMSQIEIESAFEVLARARALEASGRNIIHLEIGEPDFPTPSNVTEAAKQALDEGWTHYGPTQGYPELRSAIADHVSATRGIKVRPEQVCVVPGGKPILFFAMLALVEPGDEVILPDPGFPIYHSLVRFLGAVPVPIPLLENRGFAFDIDALQRGLTNRTKLLILNSPQNPTGGIIPEEQVREIADLIRERDLMVISDEIYSRIYYAEPPFSIASLDTMREKTIILDGFSKAYAMTGWRLGYGVMPEWIVDAINRLMVNSNSCTASFTQRAGLAAIQGSQEPVTRMVEEFRRRRDVFCSAINDIPGFRCALPGGAFYAFANVQGTGIQSKKLADLLLSEAGVACLDGASFGLQGTGYLRFSYANSLENLQEAVRRIASISGRWTG
jgi:aspartate aminotransferase